jgi:hypothetical protein
MNGLLGGGLGLAGRLGFCSSGLSTGIDREPKSLFLGSNSRLFAAARLTGTGAYGSTSGLTLVVLSWPSGRDGAVGGNINGRLGLTPRLVGMLVGMLAGCSRYKVGVSAGCKASLSVAWPYTELRLAGILGFSKRLGGGAVRGSGSGFAGGSLRNSPDLLGGGGSGGCEAGEGDNSGGFRDSTSGV